MVTLKTPQKIEIMARAGKILAEAILTTAGAVRPGVSLLELDKIAEKIIRKNGAEPAFLGYEPYGASAPYPATLCLSINEIIVHGLPNKYKLRPGDVLKIDGGVLLDGYYVDSAITLGVNGITPEAERLIGATKKALMAGIRQTRIGNTLGDIGNAISKVAAQYRIKMVEGLTGHGVGQELHEDPVVYNDGKPGTGMRLQEGMVLAIEPMASLGTAKIVKLGDDSYATEDGSLSAHFEHTVAITKEGPRILT
jgi:methionyl aminopeptidase